MLPLRSRANILVLKLNFLKPSVLERKDCGENLVASTNSERMCISATFEMRTDRDAATRDNDVIT